MATMETIILITTMLPLLISGIILLLTTRIIEFVTFTGHSIMVDEVMTEMKDVAMVSSNSYNRNGKNRNLNAATVSEEGDNNSNCTNGKNAVLFLVQAARAKLCYKQISTGQWFNERKHLVAILVVQ